MKLSHRNQFSTHRSVRRTVLWCSVLLMGLLPANAVAQGASASEYAIKAAIIFKIAKFVSWPEDAYSSRSEPLSICIFEDDPISPAISALRGKAVHGRAFAVRFIDEGPVTNGRCQILFLSNLHKTKQSSLLNIATGQSILTIGDDEQFTNRGGIVGLEIASDRVQFTINTTASESAGLNISAQLLQLAEITENHQGT